MNIEQKTKICNIIHQQNKYHDKSDSSLPKT